MTHAVLFLEPAICVMMDIQGQFVIMVYVMFVLVFNGKRYRLKGYISLNYANLACAAIVRHLQH